MQLSSPKGDRFLRKKPWTDEEDNLVRKLVHGIRHGVLWVVEGDEQHDKPSQ